MSKAITKVEDHALTVSPERLKDLVLNNIGEQGVSAGDLTRIKNPGGDNTKWSVPALDGDEDTLKEVEGVIVFHKLSRARWEGEYKGGGEAPLCKSKDGFTGVGEPGGSCGSPKNPVCPYAKFGEDGTKPDCRLVKQLFIRRPGKLLPDVFTVTAINIKQCDRYMFNLLNDMVNYNEVVTKITASTSVSKKGQNYAKFHFVATSHLPEEQKKSMAQYTQLIKPMLLEIEVNDEDVVESNEEPF